MTIASCTGDDAKFNGAWSVVEENADFARGQEAEKGFNLERYCDVTLS